MRELVLTLVIVGVVAIVGLLIFTKVKNSTDTILDPDIARQINETVAIIQIDGSDNSTLLTQSRVLTDTERVSNSSNISEVVVRGTDYSITLTGTSGAKGTRANFTWLGDNSYNFSNTTGVFISYNYNVVSAAQTSSDVITTTVLDSFSLGVIALIVLAAVAILAILFKLGSQ